MRARARVNGTPKWNLSCLELRVTAAFDAQQSDRRSQE